MRQRFLQTQVGLARGTATPWQLKGALPEPLLVFPLREPQPAAAAAACLPAGDRLPEFCCSAGLLTRIDPGLEVPRAGLDRLTLPLEEGQAAALLEALEGKRVGLFRKVQVQNPSEPEGLLLHLRNGGMDAPAGGSPQWLPGGMCAMLLQDCNVPPPQERNVRCLRPLQGGRPRLWPRLCGTPGLRCAFSQKLVSAPGSSRALWLAGRLASCLKLQT